MKNILSAWDNMFNGKQWEAIRQMSLHVDKKAVKLHDVIATLKMDSVYNQKSKETGFVKKPIRKCPKCGGVLKLFSVHKKENAIAQSKWECCKTCKGGGCGYIEYLNEDIETILEGVRDGSSK